MATRPIAGTGADPPCTRDCCGPTTDGGCHCFDKGFICCCPCLRPYYAMVRSWLDQWLPAKQSPATISVPIAPPPLGTLGALPASTPAPIAPIEDIELPELPPERRPSQPSTRPVSIDNEACSVSNSVLEQAAEDIRSDIQFAHAFLS